MWESQGWHLVCSSHPVTGPGPVQCPLPALGTPLEVQLAGRCQAGVSGSGVMLWCANTGRYQHCGLRGHQQGRARQCLAGGLAWKAAAGGGLLLPLGSSSLCSPQLLVLQHRGPRKGGKERSEPASATQSVALARHNPSEPPSGLG